jgi:hypothetical protein
MMAVLHKTRVWQGQKNSRGSVASRFWLAALLAGGCRPAPSGSVVSYETKRPILNATILHAGKTIRTDARGEFALSRLDQTQPLLIKASGFWPKRCAIPAERWPRFELDPLETRGLYLSYATLGSPESRARAMRLLDGERLNTLAVDIKDRQGRMTFYNGAPWAGQVGAFGAVKFDDVQAFLKEMHQKHIYVLGRLAIFRDPLLAKHNPEWAVRASGRPNSFWLDPYRKEVWTYNLAIAKEAAALGFDEVEFDCVWFPAGGEVPGAQYSCRDSVGNRVRAIETFVSQASQTLAPHNVCCSLAPGTVLRWEGRRSGQGLGRLTQSVEYLGLGLRKLPDLAIIKAATAVEPRQWRAYIECGETSPKEPSATSGEVKAMAEACRSAGFSGWMLSDPRNPSILSQDFIRELIPGDP